MRTTTTMITTTLVKNKVLLGLSGGVDSTTAALFLRERGLDVTGFYFDVLGNNEEGVEGAKEVADELGIDLIVYDASEIFKKIVIQDFLNSYSEGRTPNPCVMCNPNIKFKLLINHANSIGAYYIATGHYAQVYHDHDKDRFFISAGANRLKDQSYMLYRLGQDVLGRLILPLGNATNKDDVRSFARENNMSNWEKSDSQEICFLESDAGYASYIENQGRKLQPGDFVDLNGRVLGRHKGIHHYTIGQRKGLGIALGRPVFVTCIDSVRNTVTLGSNDDLMKKRIFSRDNFFTETSSQDMPEEYESGFECMAKIRYGAKPAFAHVRKADGRNGILQVEFDEPQRAPCPGQSLVFYIDDKVIGGGFIESCNSDFVH